MKKTYAFFLSGAMLMSVGLMSCTGENTTGVDTETTANEVDGQLNDPDEGAMTEENISPLDTANAGTGANMDENNATGSDTPRTTTPATDSNN